MNNLLPLVLLLIGGIIVTFGDIVLKKWVETNQGYLYIIGLSIYLLGAIFLAQSYKYKNIAVASVIFIIFNVIALSLVSWFYFKEKLTILEIFGIGLGILTVIILELGKK